MTDARAGVPPVPPALAAWSALRASGAARGALVTLVRADGGASRTLGTRLAVSDDGRAFGSVTVGGCADGRALQAAARVLATGAVERLTLPLSEDDALALGLGCAGDVDLFVERVTLDAGDIAARVLDEAVAASARGEPTMLVTALHEPRGRLLVRADGTTIGGTGDAARDAAAASMALEAMRGDGEVSGLREDAGGAWFVERITPVRTLLVVGATEIAAALCTLAAPLGWHVVLLDPRDEVLAQPRFAAAAERVPCIPGEVVTRRMRAADGPAVVVVAHDYRVELPVLRAALAGGAAYVGMLGSRKRGAAMRTMLADDGLRAEDVARLRTPIGLAIGAQGPAEIAVSILAELIATWRGAAPAP
jgi:xanthine dehydrogenase accessory factor